MALARVAKAFWFYTLTLFLKGFNMIDAEKILDLLHDARELLIEGPSDRTSKHDKGEIICVLETLLHAAKTLKTGGES